MPLNSDISIHPLPFSKSGNSEFSTPIHSNETIVAIVPSNTKEELFCHRGQVDQLFVVSGELVLITLHNGKYRYTYMSDEKREYVKIPNGIPHSAVNFSRYPCVVVNALIRLRHPTPSDYRSIKPPFEYDLEMARAAARRPLPQMQQVLR